MGRVLFALPDRRAFFRKSRCAFNSIFGAENRIHNGLLTLQSGGKMSKSDKGSVFRICDAVQEFPGEAIKLYLLQNHYRSPLLWEDDSLPDALAKLSRLYEAREAGEAMGGE